MRRRRSAPRAAAAVVLLALACSARAEAQSESPLFLRYVEPPSPTFTTYVEGELIRVSVPANWRERPASNAVTFAPQGAYGTVGVRSVFTHGVVMGLALNDAGDLAVTTGDFIGSRVLAERTPGRKLEYREVLLADRPALHAALWTMSEATGEPERVDIFTTLLRNGTLFYVLAVSPRECALDYVGTFERVVGSIEILDCIGCTH